MHMMKDKLWTWLLPDTERSVDEDQWFHHGGKWIIFGRKAQIVRLAEKVSTFIDTGEIQSAKYWNGDPSAINVYALDRDKEKTRGILHKLGAGNRIVWEYDYAWCRNLTSPVSFLYSWSSKFVTIVRSCGIRDTLELIREFFLTR